MLSFTVRGPGEGVSEKAFLRMCKMLGRSVEPVERTNPVECLIVNLLSIRRQQQQPTKTATNERNFQHSGEWGQY